MRIPPFYTKQLYGTPSCSDPKYTTKNTCENEGQQWNESAIYTQEKFKPDEHISDFYYTGIHKMQFSIGPPAGFKYVGAYSPGTAYSSGDLVSHQPSPEGGHHPEKKFYALKVEHDTTHEPSASSPEGDSKFDHVAVKSYIYEGIGGALDPGAYHAYDNIQQKTDRRYNEGAMATAKEAEMGVTDVKVGRGSFETWYNQENDPKQFYVTDYGNFTIYETCHGTRPAYMHGTSGNFNFYNAMYPGGYFLPPYGERPTLTLIGSQEESSVGFSETDFVLLDFSPGSCCAKLEKEKDTLGMWGIRTVMPKKGPIVTFSLSRGQEHGIHAPYEECPPELPPQYYLEREDFGYHPGSIMAPGAGSYYNDNPFPNSLDIDGWIGGHVYKTQKCYQGGGGIYLGYKLKASFPDMTMPVAGANEKKLDAGTCKARDCETTQLLEYSFQGVQGGMGTGPGAAVNDSASFATYDGFTYWHFIFRYNHDSLWNQTENTLTNEVTNFGEGAKVGQIEEHMWEYRQCPNTPDFLPYSADNPIHACPSHYFDIPYYASIGKFGFYGARFFNSCSTPVAEPVGQTNVNAGREYNYYTAQRANNDGTDFVGDEITVKGLAERTEATSAILSINNGCYNVKFVETSTEDRAVDLVIASTSPKYEPSTQTIDLKYDVVKRNVLGNLKLEETITWDTLTIDATACENCVNGGKAAVEAARALLEVKLESKFGKTMDEIRAMVKCVRGAHGGGFICDPSSLQETGRPHHMGGKHPAPCGCDPYIQHGSDGFKIETTIDDAFGALDSILRAHTVRFGADTIHGTEGTYSTFESQVDLVRDWPAGVVDCDPYEEPGVKAGVCDQAHYDSLLEIASNEERINEYFVGNQGFFLWANYDHIVNSTEYKTYLTGAWPGDPAEVHFKRCLFRLKQDFDQILLSLPNFFSGNNDPVIYYENAQDGLYGNQTLNFSRIGLFNEMLFSNNRFRRFVKETEYHDERNLFNYSDEYQEDGKQKPGHTTQQRAWEILLERYGRYIATDGGGIDSSWYFEAVEAKERRILTRFIENKLRGKAIDLYPTNKISFSQDSASPYITGKHWGNSKWGDSTVGHYKGPSMFDPLDGVEDWNGGPDGDQPNPGVMRRYFHGVFANKASATGYFKEIQNAQSYGGSHYYAGLFTDWSCGGDAPMAKYNAGGVAVDVAGKGIPANPWVTQGHNEVGQVNQGFSCFSPIYIQQPLNVSCKIGQRPVFRAHAVDYHTIPEDKIGQGHPEIDYWTNSLKLTNSKGELKYPIKYQWYRMLKKQDPRAKTYIKPDGLDTTFEEWFYEIEPILQKATVTGEWACMEGVSGVGGEECTMFHPQVSYTHEMTEGWTDYTAEGNEVGHSPYGLGGDGDRKYGADHWGRVVDYKGEVRGINSAKKQGDHRLWKTWAYIQGAYTSQGKVERDYGGASEATDGIVCSAIPIFDNREDKTYYKDVLKEEYGLTNPWGDDDYVYFCVASGRFGFRRSEYANLDIEDWVKMDISVRNGGPMTIPFNAVSYQYTRVDQQADTLDNMTDPCEGVEEDGFDSISACQVPGGPENGGPRGEGMTMVNSFGVVNLQMGWGAPQDGRYSWMVQGMIPPFAGTERDQNQVWESEVREHMNMSNNCRSFSFVGNEGYRGSTRTYRPPTMGNVQGTESDYAGWLNYGLLFPFGTALSQAWGNALYSQSQLPVCRGWFMPKGMTAQRFVARVTLAEGAGLTDTFTKAMPDICGVVVDTPVSESLAGNYLRNLGFEGGQGQAIAALESAPTFTYHYTASDRAVICIDLQAGVPPSKFYHQGGLYPYNDQDSMYMYECYTIAHHGRGVTWQFSNNLGVIKRFGKFVPLPDVTPPPPEYVSEGGVKGWAKEKISWKTSAQLNYMPTFEDTPDVYFWAWNRLGEMFHQFKNYKLHIWSTSLAGINCGWHPFGCGRFMLYFVEAHQRYYLMCKPNGKKRTINKSFIAPGLRHGSSGVNYFTGGFPSSTYVKRTGLVGPYAYEWKVAPHNRDRNGNGIAESFYSTRHNRVMHLYDPPAIYGLWAKQDNQVGLKLNPRVKRVRKLRNMSCNPYPSGGPGASGPSLAQKAAWSGGRSTGLPPMIKGLRFGPPGMAKHGGCGSYRLGCVEAPHRRRPAFFFPGDSACEWYTYAIKMGCDHGNQYGCNEQQLMAGVCFDPCLSMKYNYGFFPGGKLLTLNNFVKYGVSRHNAEPDSAAGTAPGGKISDLHKRDDGATRIPPSESTQHSSKAAAKASSQQIAHPEAYQAERASEQGKIEINTKLKNSGARFITQLTGDVADEEMAISKSRSSKFVRLLRGPWATPYRRIKKAGFDMLGVVTDPTSSDVVNKERTTFMGVDPVAHAKYGHPQNLLPNPKRASQVATETSVSPCNAYGADHCNYLTPTIHFGMDTQVMAMESTFGAAAASLGGGYVRSKELSVMGEINRQNMAFASFLITNTAMIGIYAGLNIATGGVGMLAGTVASLALGIPIGPGAAIQQLIASGVIGAALDAYLTRMCPQGVTENVKNGLMGALEGMGFNTTPTLPTGLEVEIGTRSLTSAQGMAHTGAVVGLHEAYLQGRVVVL